MVRVPEASRMKGLDRLFGHCESYPEGAQRTREQRLAYHRETHPRLIA